MTGRWMLFWTALGGIAGAVSAAIAILQYSSREPASVAREEMTEPPAPGSQVAAHLAEAAPPPSGRAEPQPEMIAALPVNGPVREPRSIQQPIAAAPAPASTAPARENADLLFEYEGR